LRHEQWFAATEGVRGARLRPLESSSLTASSCERQPRSDAGNQRARRVVDNSEISLSAADSKRDTSP
jgi:hypothetical protein